MVNLTTVTLSKPMLELLTGNEFIDTVLNLTLDKTFRFANYAAMFLCNITKDNHESEAVFKVMNKNNNFNIHSFLDAFCDVKYNEHCELHHIGSLLANLTLLKDARLLLLDREKDCIQRLLPFTQYADSNVRRYSVAAIIKNCLFETGAVSYTHLTLPTIYSV